MILIERKPYCAFPVVAPTPEPEPEEPTEGE